MPYYSVMNILSADSDFPATEHFCPHLLCVLGLYIQIQARSPRFFPVLKARCFKHDDDETNIRLARMEHNVQKILDRFENEVSTVLC